MARRLHSDGSAQYSLLVKIELRSAVPISIKKGAARCQWGDLQGAAFKFHSTAFAKAGPPPSRSTGTARVVNRSFQF
jgi:hypothetical protein